MSIQMEKCGDCGLEYAPEDGHLCITTNNSAAILQFDPDDGSIGSATINQRFPPQPMYMCPRHGEIDDAIVSSIEGHEGNWCQRCWLEVLDKLGVCRVEQIRDWRGNKQ